MRRKTSVEQFHVLTRVLFAIVKQIFSSPLVQHNYLERKYVEVSERKKLREVIADKVLI